MSKQLDILALEPFYGGTRRMMLDTLMRYSRHRWTLLKLPPRRMERRLTASAHWFAEIVARRHRGEFDVLFTSEALNLADFHRLAPRFIPTPSVVYFHDNQLPKPGAKGAATDMVNLNTAQAADEIWFNSLYHLRTFLSLASRFVSDNPELASQSPMEALTARSQLMPPPNDMGLVHEIRKQLKPVRKSRVVLVDMRQGNTKLVEAALGTLTRRSHKLTVLTIGSTPLNCEMQQRLINENADADHIVAMLQADTFVGTQLGALTDHHVLRAMATGVWPIVPAAGVYPELIPTPLHGHCLYNGSADSLAGRLIDRWHLELPDERDTQMAATLQQYDAMARCRAMDERLEALASKSNG